MSLYSDFIALRKKQEEEEAKKTGGKATSTQKSSESVAPVKTKSSGGSLYDEFVALRAAEEDIAPVRERVNTRTTVNKKKKDEDEDKWYKGWFQKGALDDGFSLKNVTKTILGTGADLVEDIGTGVIGMGEKIVDTFATIAPYVEQAQFLQNGGYYNPELQKQHDKAVEESKKQLTKFVEKDLYDEGKVAKKIVDGITFGYDYEADSMFGEKSDSVIQSGGQLLATMGLQAVGVPWFLTTGATAFGGEAENAFNEGATYEEAVLSSTIAAGAEMLTEKLSGGIKFGGKALDDVLTDQIARGISNKFVRKLAKFGLDAFGEGAEEWITEDLNIFGQWLTYRDEEELKELLFSEAAMDEKIEAFIGGAALGGVSNVGNAIKSEIKGIDSVSGRTKNEEAVVKKIYEDLVAEAEQDGKVSAKQKSKIYDRVTRELEKGGISTDTIEELLDEEGYKAFQAEKDNFFKSDIKKTYDDALKSEAEQLKQLKEQLDKLNDAPNTVGNNRQYDSIVSQITELENNPGSKAIKAQLDQEVKRINAVHNELRTKVHNMVKGTKLEESYNELIRSNQDYEVDLEKYTDPNARKTIENILKSGMGDNTNHFHEYADWLAQISADKGMSFSLTNNEALKGTEHDFSAEGKIANGFLTEDGITLNMDSPKALNSTVGHEITHVLEQNAELYQTLQDTVFKYEIAKNGQEAFDKRLNDTIKRYKGKDADAKAELTADLIGDYLFTDYDFAHNLSVENRNLFQKIYDEIKYLCKVVTAGSKEARELEKVKKAFDDAYRANVKGKPVTKTQHSLSDSKGNKLTKEQQEFFKDSQVRDEEGYLIPLYHGTPSKFTIFDTTKGRHGIYLTANQQLADSYGSNTIRAYANIKNPKRIDANYAMAKTWDMSKIAREAQEEGYDGLIISNLVHSGNQNYDSTLWMLAPEAMMEKDIAKDKIDQIDDVTGFSDKIYDITGYDVALDIYTDQNVLWKAQVESGEMYNSRASKQLAKLEPIQREIATYVEQYNLAQEEIRKAERENASSISDTVYVAFESKQIKNIVNEKPTSDPDIRYSLSETSDSLNDDDIDIDDLELDLDLFLDDSNIDWDEILGTKWISNMDSKASETEIAPTQVESEPEQAKEWLPSSMEEIKQMYQDAIDRGDIPKAQRIVDEVARLAGYTQKGYHGTSEEFNAFSEDKISAANVWGKGFYFGTTKSIADDYAYSGGGKERVVSAYLKMENPFIPRESSLGTAGEILDKWFPDMWKGTRELGIGYINGKLKNDPHDLLQFIASKNGIEIRDVLSYYGYDSVKSYGELVVFNPTQIKSSDAVTFDDAGNWLPVTERFNKETPDIRYSLSEADDAYFDAVTNSDWETAEKMVDEAAKKAGYTKAVYHGTDARFTVFDTDEESTAREEHAWMADYPDGTIFLAEDYEVADGYGERVMPLYLDTTDMKVFEEPDMYAHRAMDDLYGYEVYNYPVIAVKGKDMTIYATLDNTLVKSSDTVTFGDGGEIIPLSERFKHSNEDIRYSLSEDSEGRKLSENQEKYFAGSKVADENGKLKAVYHGSPVDFNTFSLKYLGTNGTAEGYGFYFTDKKSIAEGYSKGYEGRQNGKPGKLFECYLDIKKPLSDTEVTMTRAQFKKFLTTLNNYVDADGERLDVLSNYGDVEWEGLNKVLNYAMEAEYDGSDNDVNLVHSIINGCGDMKAVFDVLRETVGYDGIIVNEASWGGDQTIYIAFHPEQIKNIDNLNPTTNPDIRYSLSEDTERVFYTPIGVEVVQNPTNAEYRQMREDIYKEYPWLRGTGEAILRHTYDESGNEYYWNAYDGMHRDVEPYINKQYNTRTSQHWEWWTRPDKDDYPADYSYLQHSMSDTNEKSKQHGDWNVYGNDFGYKGDFAPVIPTPTRQSLLPGERHSVAEMFPDEPDVSQAEYDNLVEVKESLENWMQELSNADLDNPEIFNEFEQVNEKLVETYTRLLELDNELSDSDRVDSLMDAEAPPEMDAPYYESNPTTLTKKATADIVRDVRASLDVKNNEVSDLKDIVEQYRAGEIQTREDLVNALQDKFGTYTESVVDERLAELKREIRTRRLKVSDTIKHGIADYVDVMRHNRGKIRFSKDGLDVDTLYKELQEDFADYFNEDEQLSPENMFRQIVDIANTPHVEEVQRNKDIENIEEAADLIINGIGDFKRNQDLDLSNRESKQAFESLVRQGDKYAPMDDIAPVKPVAPAAKKAPAKPTTKPAAKTQAKQNPQVAKVHTVEPKTQKRTNKAWSLFKEHVLDKGMVFEDLSKKTGNRKLEAKWNFIRNSGARAQRLIGKGANGVKALTDIRKTVEKSGKTDKFFDYLYHVHNIDRMTLADRFKGTPNKAVFGDTITADISRQEAARLLKQNPEFKQWSQDVYKFNKHLRKLLVDGGVISQEVANLWEKMYPHYVPIRRDGDTGLNVNVPLDTNKTGINAPVKRATGGSRDILPLFDTMAMRAEQTYRAIAKNNFGIELKNMLGSTIANEAQTVDGVIDSLDSDDALLKPGANGMNPTFTVFENGERVEFEITDEMYNAMKPTNDFFASTSKVLNGISNFRRGTLTEYNPWFMLKNAIKDQQDVLLNSQHPLKTYANMPVAIAEMAANGEYYQEYLENGGEQNTYFDTESNTFEENKVWEAVKWATGLNEIAWANNKIEMLPRLAEYIASRNEGRSIEVSMLDAARVTTNFAAGGDVTKWANRNGVTFLNASVQGAIQQVRNVREAKQNGVKGVLGLAAKYLAAGLPAVLLNNLLWEDDEEYEELADYVKRDYYVVGKFDDGKFVRIPKGRAVAVIQHAMERMDDVRTGDDEADMKTFLDIAWDTLMLAKDNVAPNNPLDNNVISPITQVLKNKTWYGEDLIPSRLQDVPAAEQFDESTDDISRWLGENTNTSPMKWNYLLDQYSGVLGDTFLPMLTPEAESGDDTTLGTITAPLRDMFTTDSVINNQISGDFYDTKDLVDIAANSSKATDEDKMKSTYMQAVGWELSDLYAQKRELQNSNMADSIKYKQSRDIQKQINEIMEDAMGGYEDVSINGLYSEVGNKRFNQDAESGKWYEIKPKNADGSDNWYYQMEQDVTKALGISYGEYWNNREEYNYAYEKPEQYALSKAVGGYKAYRSYTSTLYDFKADYDENGKAISGSKKAKVKDYIFNDLDLDYGEKLILYRSQYDSQADKDAYNYDIIMYLCSRDDISYQEMEKILKYLDFKIDSNGNITW